MAHTATAKNREEQQPPASLWNQAVNVLYRTRQGLRRGKAPRRQYPCAPAMGSPGGWAGTRPRREAKRPPAKHAVVAPAEQGEAWAAGEFFFIIRTFLFLYGLSFSSKSKPPLCLLCSSGSTNSARLRVGFKSLYQLPVPVEGQCAVAHSTVPLQLAFKIGWFRPVPDFAGLRSARARR